jgi:hypothetical protein
LVFYYSFLFFVFEFAALIGDWEENNREEAIDRWYSLNGTTYNWPEVTLKFFTKIIDPASKSKEPFTHLEEEKDWGKYRHVSVEGWTGNEGCNRTTTYSKYILALWPKKDEFKTFLKIDPNYCVNLLHHSFDPERFDPKFLEQFKFLVHGHRKRFNEQSIAKVLQILEKLGGQCLDMFKEFLETYLIDRSLPVIQIAKCVVSFGWDSVKTSYVKWTNSNISLDGMNTSCNLVKVKLFYDQLFLDIVN